MLNLVRLACSFGLAFSSLGSGLFVDPHNATDHAVAAIDLPLQKPRLGDSSCIRLLSDFFHPDFPMPVPAEDQDENDRQSGD